MRARRPERAPARHRVDQDPRARSAAAAPSRGARRAPAAPAPARSARRSGPAAASSSAPAALTTRSRSTARRAAPRCAARSRCTLAAARSPCSTPAASTRRRPSSAAELLARLGAARARRSSCSGATRRRRPSRFRNIARVNVLAGRRRRRRRHRRRRLAAGLRGALEALTPRARARRAAARDATAPPGGRVMDAEPGDHPPDRLREELRARRGRASTRSGSTRRRTRRRSARRSRSCSTSTVVEVRTMNVQAPSPSGAATPPAARGSGRRRSCRSQPGQTHPDVRRASSSARGVADADQQAQAHIARPALRDLRRLRRAHQEASPRSRSSRALTKSGGRNAHGRKTSRHRGGGAKRLYRRIDFKRTKDGVPARVARDRVRPQPLGLHRAAALRRRREALHPRAEPAAGRR